MNQGKNREGGHTCARSIRGFLGALTASSWDPAKRCSGRNYRKTVVDLRDRYPGERIGDLPSDRWRPSWKGEDSATFTTTTKTTTRLTGANRPSRRQNRERLVSVHEVRWRRIVRLPETKRFAAVVGAARTCRSAARCACLWPREKPTTDCRRGACVRS
ncbi:unnamed protein product [Lasius platythorax]|uniref:Uncharacterized protein n=1 Tax=Lasius platythorax TaxID=488582 RepID=A0AAV2NGA2_9HYME